MLPRMKAGMFALGPRFGGPGMMNLGLGSSAQPLRSKASAKSPTLQRTTARRRKDLRCGFMEEPPGVIGLFSRLALEQRAPSIPRFSRPACGARQGARHGARDHHF